MKWRSWSFARDNFVPQHELRKTCDRSRDRMNEVRIDQICSSKAKITNLPLLDEEKQTPSFGLSPGPLSRSSSWSHDVFLQISCTLPVGPWLRPDPTSPPLLKNCNGVHRKRNIAKTPKISNWRLFKLNLQEKYDFSSDQSTLTWSKESQTYFSPSGGH